MHLQPCLSSMLPDVPGGSQADPVAIREISLQLNLVGTKEMNYTGASVPEAQVGKEP